MSQVFEIPGYTIYEKIGTGSTATVWHARQDSADRKVAIKVIHPELWKQVDNPDAFIAEIQTIAQLSSRHILQVYDAGLLPNTAYIVFEFIDGETVADYLKQSQRMTPEEAMQIAAAVADALANAWQAASLIHLDIRPDNIIIKDDGRIKLADLGLARLADITIKDPTFLLGTPNYMPPEQGLAHDEITPASDMYSLGATLYHIVTGQAPFSGMPMQNIFDAHLHEQLPWPAEIAPDIPDTCCQFIAKLMMKDPAERIADWNDVYHLALQLAANENVSIELSEEAPSTIAPPTVMETETSAEAADARTKTSAEEVFEIPGYTILEKIGTGSTATVWRARQESLDRDVAIKVMHPQLWTQMEEASAFLAEAQSVAQLHSRHIIQVYDTGYLANTAYIVLEYVAGETVAQQLKRDGKMPPQQAMQIAAAVADALSDAWKTTGMIHRDIKPENIIIEQDGSVKLADLGLARSADFDPESPGAHSIVGTPNFMSPEQAKGDIQVSPTTDMYSLGATLYQMLTGRVPFAGMPVEDILEAQTQKQLPWLQDIDPQIPLSYCQFVTRLMMKDPADRFQDWTTVYRDAAKLAQGRMMMIKIPNGARSTVASAGKMPTGGKRKIKVPQKPKHIPTATVTPPPKVPLWIQRSLTWTRWASILLILWFFVASPIIQTWDQETEVELAPSLTDPQPTVDEEDVEDPADPTPTAPEEDEEEPSPEPTEEAEPTLTESEATKQEVLHQLIQQNYENARTYWRENEQTITSSLRRSRISEFLQPDHMPDTLIRNVLQQRYQDRPIDLQIEGETVSVQIESIDNDTVEGMQLREAGSGTVMNPITFRISLLSHTDQLRLLNESISSYAPHAKAIVALQGGDYETALQHAAQMGPMQATVETFASNRIELLTQR